MWTAAKDGKGYGILNVEGRTRRAHREVMKAEGHDIEGKVVRHRCDNPSCVRPDHLILGTQKDNVEDCVRRKRRADKKGSKNGFSKLTEDQVRTIKKDPRVQTVIAADYGVGQSTIAAIKSGQNWSHIK